MMNTEAPSPATITFLGTAGARIMVAKQILASGGMWMSLAGEEILVDPGPGCIVQVTKRKLDPTRLKAIILSHRHLDHASDINVMIEAMTEGGFKKRGLVFAPADALEGDPVILKYLRSFPEKIYVLEEGKTYRVGEVSFTPPLRHDHGVETYGFNFQLPGVTFSYIADSRFFPELPGAYHGQVLVINVVRKDPGHPFFHLSLADVKTIMLEIKPRAVVLTHFGMNMWRDKPWELAENLSLETGIKTIAARDGMKLDLVELAGGI
ncbi:MAG: MBL fold metallo-hydrolase [Dehalococcoidia bacterium]|nr:MBL fold metallo-hydrolase [Dehalococcoidia bacterium]